MLVFKNRGLVPEAAVTTMGVNAKIGDNPIGQFGTGLKYAIAIVLRLGGRISIWRGQKEWVFAYADQTIRGREFRIVTMNGRKLGFTDQLGLNWEPWMAYRELTSNVRDEGGTVRLWPYDEDPPQGEKNTTTVVVDCPELDRAHAERHGIFLQTEPMWSLPGVDVHPGESEFVFYRGIRVMKLGKKSLHTYNLTKSISLTEDRTILYPSLVPMYLVEAIMQATSDMFLRSVLSSDQAGEKYEGRLPYESYKRGTVPSDQFMDACESLRAAKKLVFGASAAYGYHADRSETRSSPHDYSPSTLEETRLEKAIARVAERGMRIQRHEVYFKSSLENGRVQMGTRGRVILADRLLRDTEDHLARALIEARVLLAGGGMAEQLTNFVLTGEFVAEELTEGYRPRSVVDEMVF